MMPIGRKLYSDAVISIMLRALSVVLGFGVTFLVARKLGVNGVAIYGLLIQSATIVALVASGGLDLALVRELSRPDIEIPPGDRITLRTVTFTVIIVTLAIGTIVGGVAAPWVAPSLNIVGLGTIAIVCALSLVRSVGKICGAYCRFNGFVFHAQLSETVVPTFLILCLIAGGPRSLDWLLISCAIGSILGIAYCFVTVQHVRSSEQRHLPGLDRCALIGTAAPLWLVAVSAALADWLALTIVTMQNELAQAGAYRAAAQCAVAFSIVSFGIASAYTARLTVAYSRGDGAAVRKIFSVSSRIGLAFIILPAAAAFAAASPVMALFGTEFVQGAGCLRILLLGQIASSFFTMSGIGLAVSGNGRANMMISVGSLVFVSLGAPVAGGIYGPEGVAGILAIAQVGRNLIAAAVLTTRSRPSLQ